jgi:succinoglycan biosynthesis protein ExoV
LGISESLAITDAAVLIREVELPPVQVSRQKVGFIPHARSNHYYDWAGVCGELGFAYIDARQSVDEVLAKIRSCDLLLCEAMHGAIVADALRVPWIPVVCYDYISEFKWRDWLASVGLEYAPHRITSLYHLERNWAPGKRFKIEVKRALYAGGLLRGRGWSPPARRTGHDEYRSAVAELKAASLSRPYLSGDKLLNALTNRYVDSLAALKLSQGHL